MKKIKILCAALAALLIVLPLSSCMKDGRDGVDGQDGADGQNGVDGRDGSSAYELACAAGFSGTLDEWLDSLCGAGIVSVSVNEEKHLIVSLTNGSVIDAGYVGDTKKDDKKPANETDADGYLIVDQTVRVIAGALNIRSTPDSSTAANIVTYLPEGTELRRVGIGTDGNNWSRVIYDGRVCYASGRYLEVKESFEDVDLSGIEIPRVNLFDTYTLLVGQQTCFEVSEFVTGLEAGMFTSFEYSGSGAKRLTEDSIAITPNTAEEAYLTFSIKKYVGGRLCVIYSKTVKLVSVELTKKKLTGLVIGDSRISDGTIVDTLKNVFGESLTLIGTRKTKNGNAHEGRPSWSTSNYLSYASASGFDNVFLNPASGVFDLEYYLTKNSFSAPDFIVMNLGANDAYSSLSILNYRALVGSVVSYNEKHGTSIRVLIMTEYLAPEGGFSVNYAFDAAERRAEQFEYFIKLKDAFGDDKNVCLVPNYIVVNDTDDRINSYVASSSISETGQMMITDVIHLSKAGYIKEAWCLCAAISGIFA